MNELRKPAPWLLVVTGVLFLSSMLGAAFSPYLLLHHPLVLLALAPWPRHMILIAPLLPLVPFLIVATLRAFASCALGFALGLHYGASGFAFFEQRSQRLGRVALWVTNSFGHAGYVIILLFPGPLTAGLAAISGLRAQLALPLLLLGQAGWVYANYRLGQALVEWTKPVIELVRAHVGEATVVCVVCVLAYEIFRRKRRARLAQARALLTHE